jgi:hypothetical protein
VLSAYLRTDKPGYQVAMVVGWGSYGVRSLTSEWQRYVLRTRCPQDVERQSLRIICTPGDATVWVDAVQFEEGTEPTEYREWRE